MRFGTELARLLELDLLGLFVKEERLLSLVGFPFVREFDPLGGGWRPLDFDRLSHDLDLAARSAERAFTQAAKTVPTTCRFEVVNGSMIDAIASTSRADDIVLLFGEAASTTRAETPAFMAVLDAALQSSAAVLLVPPRIARQSGAVVAVTSGPKDQSVEIASAIAAAAKEDLIVIEASLTKKAHLAGDARRPIGIPHRRIVASGDRNAAAIALALCEIRERLVVMTRGDDDIAPKIASMRQIPVLIVGPGIETLAA